MDIDCNRIDRGESVCAGLIALDKVSEEDLVPILEHFDEIDTDKSSVLTQQNLQKL